MKIEQNTKDIFLSLIRLGIGTGDGVPSLPGQVDWPAVYALAQGHGLTAVLVDGIDRLPDSARSPKSLLMQWIGGAVQNHERRFEQCRAMTPSRARSTVKWIWLFAKRMWCCWLWM